MAFSARAASDWVAAELTPTLGPALVALARAKPEKPVEWLANWLLANKPPPKLQPAGTAATMQAFVDAMNSPEAKAELKALFESCDTDGNGSVTSKEWGKAVAKNWKTMAKYFGGATMPEVGKAFKKLDADGSGDLTWYEFELAISSMDVSLRLAEKLATQEGAAELRKLFDTLDKNGKRAPRVDSLPCLCTSGPPHGAIERPAPLRSLAMCLSLFSLSQVTAR